MVYQSMRSEYSVVAVLDDDKRWVAEVEDLPAAHADARNLETLDRYVREVIVLAEDLPDDAGPDLRLAWQYHTGDGYVDDELTDLRRLRSMLEEAQRDLEARTRKVLAGMREHSMRDASAMLGVSRARVQQLSDRS